MLEDVVVAVSAVVAETTVADLLSADETSRVEALRDPADRAASASSAALLRLLLEQLTGRPAASHAFVRRCGACGGPHGKPLLLDAPLHTSRSSVRGLVAAAVTAAGPVGVDVERDSATAFDGFDGVALAGGEIASGPAQRCRTWTRKEAVLKATGVGLAHGLQGVRVSAPDAAPAVLAGVGPVRLLDVPAPDGTHCSAAVLTTGRVRLRVVDGSVLLRR